uniref:Uncharacterized protein n=1 Tax=Syphacia muris TaxID=451379 RepID=A0A0N5B0V4_9BILA
MMVNQLDIFVTFVLILLLPEICSSVRAKVDNIKYVSDPVELLTKRQYPSIDDHQQQHQQSQNAVPIRSVSFTPEKKRNILETKYFTTKELLKKRNYDSPMDVIGSTFLAKRKSQIVPFFSYFSSFYFA